MASSLAAVGWGSHKSQYTPRAGPQLQSCVLNVTALEAWSPLTIVAAVIHQNDFLQELGRCMVDHTVYGAQDNGKCLIDKDEDHGDLGKVFRVCYLFAPVEAWWSSEGDPQCWAITWKRKMK